jgi:competence protein ComEC
MGAAGILALLAGRPRSRWYVLLLSGFVTLLWNPRWIADPGWQLSFAATAGIAIGAHPIREALLAPAQDASRARRAIAEGAAMTMAATIATAPVAALHFGTFSPAALPANLLALPAEAPVMWAGMLIAMLAQVPAVPGATFEVLGWIAGALAGYIGLIAERLAAPRWSQVELEAARPATVIAATLIAAAAVGLAASILRRHRAQRPRPSRVAVSRGVLVAALAALACTGAALATVRPGSDEVSRAALEVSLLDIGQGDAILLEPARGDPVLVDAGPPGADIADLLRDEGVARLAAVVITHDQADHAGGLDEILDQFEVGAVLTGAPTPALRSQAGSGGHSLSRLSAGDVLRSGRLRLEVLWPSLDALSTATAETDPNATSLVAIARVGAFSILLTGDAESELAPLDPGPVDVLKVAHHGSADAGLGTLLARASPQLAVISVGSDNPFGHPTPEALAELDDAGVRALRTDLEGEIELRAHADRTFEVG